MHMARPGIVLALCWMTALTGCFEAGGQTPSAAGGGSSLTAWERAKAAIEARDAATARACALQMLRENRDPKAWYYGNVVHEANQILGLAALQQGNVRLARHYLLAAGKTPGSPQLDSFGPNMVLAQKLLERGERDV